MNKTEVQPLRTEALLLAKPVRIDPAFDDPESVINIIKRGAPYVPMVTLYGGDAAAGYGPWFRANWALGGRCLVEGTESLLHNPHFIEGARSSFRSRVVRPQAMMLNLTTPMQSGAPHCDVPTFRGLELVDGAEMPLMVTMRESKLFQQWAVPVAATVSWFYRGPGGEFEYWPNGSDRPSYSEQTPLWNVAVVSDNDYMYHRVGATGETKDYIAPELLTSQCLLHLTADNHWEIREGNKVNARYRIEQVRASILWRAEVFVNERAAAIRDDHSDDLDAEMIIRIFSEDLRRRGVKFREPTDLVGDSEWMQTLMDTYPYAMLDAFSPKEYNVQQ